MFFSFYGLLQKQKITITTWLKNGDSQDILIEFIDLSVRQAPLFRKQDKKNMVQ